MNGINELTADQLRLWDCRTATANGWKMARPLGRGGLRRRFAKAWKVFTGKADVLVWHNQ